MIPVSICFCHFKSSRVSITNLHQRKMELNEACHSLAETLVYFSCEKLIFLACTNLLRKVLTDFSSCIGGTLTIYIIRHRTLKQSVYRLSHTCFFAGKQFSPNKVLFFLPNDNILLQVYTISSEIDCAWSIPPLCAVSFSNAAAH